MEENATMFIAVNFNSDGLRTLMLLLNDMVKTVAIIDFIVSDLYKSLALDYIRPLYAGKNNI